MRRLRRERLSGLEADGRGEGVAANGAGDDVFAEGEALPGDEVVERLSEPEVAGAFAQPTAEADPVR